VDAYAFELAVPSLYGVESNTVTEFVDDLSVSRSDAEVASIATQHSLLYSILTESETQYNSIGVHCPGTRHGVAAGLCGSGTAANTYGDKRGEWLIAYIPRCVKSQNAKAVFRPSGHMTVWAVT